MRDHRRGWREEACRIRAGDAGVVLRAAVVGAIESEGGHRDEAGDEGSCQRAGVEVRGGAAEGWGQSVACLGGEG